MHKPILITLLMLGFFSYSKAQQVKIDSAILFQIEADPASKGASYMKSRGFVSQIAPKPNGGFGIKVFKQYFGYFKPEVSPTTPKGLVAQATYLPGLAFWSFEHGRLQKDQEVLWELGIPFRFGDILFTKNVIQLAEKHKVQNTG